jgi:hypothetical protein
MRQKILTTKRLVHLVNQQTPFDGSCLSVISLVAIHSFTVALFDVVLLLELNCGGNN